MRVRAVAAGAALAVWCMSGAAVAAGYAEVWNPPEETGHTTKQAGKKTGPATTGGTSAVGSKGASKAAPQHMAGAGHAAPSVASAHGNKPSAHGSVKKVGASGITKSKTQAAGANKTQRQAAVMTQSKKPHAQVVQAKPGQGKVAQANLVPRRTAHPPAAKVAVKSDVAKPAASGVNVPALSANPAPSTKVDANPANASSNPATASSGSLPPIIH